MKTYISDIIPRLKRYSKKLDDLTQLTNNNWVVIDESNLTKCVYVFRDNKDLIISKNGIANKGKWDYLNNNSLIIETNEISLFFKFGFLDSNILALKIDGRNEYAFLVNETIYDHDFNKIQQIFNYLSEEYLIDDYIEPINETVKIIENNEGKYAIVDLNENHLTEFKYDGIFNFSDGLARVFISKNNNDIYGFVDLNGVEVILLEYEYALCFSEGLAIIRKDRKFGFIDKSNNLVIDAIYDDAKPFIRGKAKVKIGNYSITIDKLGNQL
jgi:hypothetical protein